MSAPATLPALVLFDLDGTLADTLPDLEWALHQALEEHGLKALPGRSVRDQVSAGGRAMTRHAVDGRVADEEAVLQRFLDLYARNIAVRTRLFDGMPAVLQRLAQVGCAIGIVTNKRALHAEPLLRELAIEPAPRCIVSGDTAARPKPAADPLLHAAALAGVAPQRCVYIGDARNDVIAAQAARMPVAVACWGYISHHDEPHQWQADALLAAPADLLDWLGIGD